MKLIVALLLTAAVANAQALDAKGANPSDFVVQRTSSTSAFDEISASFSRAVVGFILFIVAFPVLWANERREAKMWRLLGRAKGIVKPDVTSTQVNSENEACLVHMQGMTSCDETLQDSQFGVCVKNSACLVRSVEMYQWVEQSETRERDNMMGGKEKVTTYTYSTSWCGSAVDSSGFQEPGHDNPAMPYSDTQQYARCVKFGAFQLALRQIRMMSNFKPLADAELPQQLLCGVHGKSFKLQSGAYSTQDARSPPQVGDLRVSFKKVPCGEASILAIQHNDSFAPFTSSMEVRNGKIAAKSTDVRNPSQPLLSKSNTAAVLDAADDVDINLEGGCCSFCSLVASLVEVREEIYGLAERKVSAGDMLQAAADAQKCIHICLQILGFFFLFIGLEMMFAVVPALFRIIPFLGTWIQMFGNFLVGMASFLLALCLWCITVSLAWFSMRPVKALLLLTLASAVVVIPTILAARA